MIPRVHCRHKIIFRLKLLTQQQNGRLLKWCVFLVQYYEIVNNNLIHRNVNLRKRTQAPIMFLDHKPIYSIMITSLTIHIRNIIFFKGIVLTRIIPL